MLRSTYIAAALVLTAILVRPASAQLSDSCGAGCPTLPKNFRAVSAEDTILATFPGNTLTATLAKGKKKAVLRVDGVLLENGSHGAGGVSREFSLGISVNGLSMRPSTAFGPGSRDATEDCGVFRPSYPDRKCNVIGHWWLDMDDPANAALIGVPITITLVGGDDFGGPAVGELVDMTLEVRLDKK